MVFQNPAAFAERALAVAEDTFGFSRYAPRGVIAGTKVDTESGWRAVETILPGDRVYTAEGSLRAVAWVDRRYCMSPRAANGRRSLLLVPVGALLNSNPLFLLPDTNIVFEAPSQQGGAEIALIPGRELVGFKGITPISSDTPMEVVTLLFSSEEIIWAESGMQVHCPAFDEADGMSRGSRYAVLREEAAQALLDQIEEGAAASGAPKPKPVKLRRLRAA
jgi:hypothetical protein